MLRHNTIVKPAKLGNVYVPSITNQLKLLQLTIITSIMEQFFNFHYTQAITTFEMTYRILINKNIVTKENYKINVLLENECCI